MKTTIEIKGYQIVIDGTEELVTVTAMKDDETVEEFSLELTEDDESQDDETKGSDSQGIKSFDDFDGDEEEEDFDDDAQDEMQDEMQDEDENEVRALESFQSFINKKK